MRLITAILAAVLVAGLALPAEAHKRKKYRSCDRYDRYERCERDWWYGWRDLFPGYQARNPDSYRYGSRAWWKAMDFDGRGGHPRL